MRTLRPVSFAVLVAVASTFVASSALADEPSTPTLPAPAEQPATSSSWYGYQTLALDGIAATVTIAGSAQKSTLPAVGLATYALGAPIVHLVHGHGFKALGDVAMRVGAPVACAFTGGLIGVVAMPNGNDPFAAMSNLFVGMMVGAVVGFGAAITIDAAVIAREDAPATNRDHARVLAPRAPSVAWAPTFTPTPRGASAGVTGTF